jgi:hypothetical protein
MAHAVRLCEQEFAQKTSISVSEFCQRLFETTPQIQLDKDARLRLLRAMRQPVATLAADGAMPTPKGSEPREPSESIPRFSPEDSASPELFMLRYANVGKEILE